MIEIEDGDSARCPVCRARFRESSVCSRCGADLEPLMLLLARTYELRKEAARCLVAGDYEQAQRLASEAQACRFTRRGANLELLSAWLLRESARETAGSAAEETAVAATIRIQPDDPGPLLQGKPEGQALIWCSVLAGIVSMGWMTVKAAQWLKGSQ
ncbi:MAG TPA: hypothetical protein VMI06_08935 [Terriglobia bacterium]|nr:hypothetical protein [Terriglobia bacterium]